MRKHLYFCLMSAAVMFMVRPVSAQTIVAVHDDKGHTVWVNNEEPAPKPQPASASVSGAASREARLVYWSNTEHRWKPVPTVPASSLRAARQAAREVATQFGALPAAHTQASRTLMASQPVAPENAGKTAASPAPEAVDSAIEAAANRHGVDPNLVRAIVKVESNFNPHAVSRKGALGLMQLMPTTARSMNVSNAFDPHQNVDAGVRHLKALLENYNGNLELTLAAYNAGSGAVSRSGGVPPYRETRDYVRKITDLYWSGATLAAFAPRIHVSKDADGHPVYSNE